MLDLALKMPTHGAVRIRIETLNDSDARLNVTPPNSELAEALAHRSSADPDQVEFKRNDDIAFGVARWSPESAGGLWAAKRTWDRTRPRSIVGPGPSLRR